jgi:hypothetical protein
MRPLSDWEVLAVLKPIRSIRVDKVAMALNSVISERL